MDENRLPGTAPGSFSANDRAISPTGTVFGEELTFAFQDLDGVHHLYLPAMAISTKRSMHCGTMSGFWNQCAISGS